MSKNQSSKTQLILKHKNSKIHRTYKVDHEAEVFTIGSSRNVNLKITGTDVSPIHASILHRGDDWYVCDLSNEGGVWTEKESITEKKIDGTMSIRLGQHEFDLKVIPINPGYYNWTERRQVAGDIHEIVVKMNGRIHHVHHRRKDEPFYFKNGVGILKLDAPKSTTWQERKVGEFTIRQRLIPQGEYLPTKENLAIANLKGYQIYTVLGVLLLLIAAALYPRDPKQIPEALEENKYAQIIYNAKIVKEKREQATKIVEKREAPSQGSQGAKGEVAKSPQVKGVTEKTVKAISQIRASGLQKLLGRISQRANSTGIQIAAGGGETGKSQVTGLTSSTLIGSENMGAVKGTGTTYGIKGVETEGKGGGGQGYKGIGQLAQGNIGQGASVGIIDDEADISGGMDKDAIAEVIRKNIGQIRFCYERRLVANPSLYGKVVVLFTIQDGGTVLQPKVAQSTLSDDVVEGCILRRLASWKFPSPPAGMSVQVTYPFLFKSTQ